MLARPLSLLTYFAVSGSVLMVFIADVGPRSGAASSIVFVAAILGLACFIRRLSQCGIFADGTEVELRTVTRTTSIPFSRLRIYGDKVSFAAQTDMVPVLSDTDGLTVKAGVLTGIDPADKLGIVRTILHLRDNATPSAAAPDID